MAQVHFARMPLVVGGRPGDVQALLQAVLVDRVDVVYPHRHPATLVRDLIVPGAEGLAVGAAAAAALRALAEKDFDLTGADGAEARRIAPLPGDFPAEFLEPVDALRKARDVEDRIDGVRFHG